jgi:hypothetical protein
MLHHSLVQDSYTFVTVSYTGSYTFVTVSYTDSYIHVTLSSTDSYTSCKCKGFAPRYQVPGFGRCV